MRKYIDDEKKEKLLKTINHFYDKLIQTNNIIVEMEDKKTNGELIPYVLIEQLERDLETEKLHLVDFINMFDK